MALSSLSFFIGAANATTAPQTPYQTGRANSGTPNSTNVTKDSSGTVISYGDSSITYNLPPAAQAALGQALYQQNCASCHGNNADGNPPQGPPNAYPNLCLLYTS